MPSSAGRAFNIGLISLINFFFISSASSLLNWTLSPICTIFIVLQAGVLQCRMDPILPSKTSSHLARTKKGNYRKERDDLRRRNVLKICVLNYCSLWRRRRRRKNWWCTMKSSEFYLFNSSTTFLAIICYERISIAIRYLWTRPPLSDALVCSGLLTGQSHSSSSGRPTDTTKPIHLLRISRRNGTVSKQPAENYCLSTKMLLRPLVVNLCTGIRRDLPEEATTTTRSWTGVQQCVVNRAVTPQRIRIWTQKAIITAVTLANGDITFSFPLVCLNARLLAPWRAMNSFVNCFTFIMFASVLRRRRRSFFFRWPGPRNEEINN